MLAAGTKNQNEARSGVKPGVSCRQGIGRLRLSITSYHAVVIRCTGKRAGMERGIQV